MQYTPTVRYRLFVYIWITYLMKKRAFPTLGILETSATNPQLMLMYGKEASNRKQEIDRQHYTIPNQRPKDKHCGKI